MISYSFLSEYRSGEKQLRLQTCMNRGLVCKAGRMFTYQSKCIYVTKKRLMHFHFENDINNPIPKLSTWNRVKIRIQLHLMIRLCEKKIKNPWHCNWVSRSNNRKTRNFLLWSVQQWLANICVGDKELHRHLLY